VVKHKAAVISKSEIKARRLIHCSGVEPT